MDESSGYQSNPWADDDRSLGGVKNVLLMAQKTGHLPKGHLQNRAQMLSEVSQKYPSLKMVSLLKNISQKQKQIDQLNFEIQQRLQDKETRDLTHLDVLEKRISDLSSLNSYLQRIISQKDLLISKLQQPYVGDFIKIEAAYKKYVSELFPQLTPVLAEMSSQLDNIEWSANVNMANDSRLDGLLSDIASTLASLQSGFQSVCQLRASISNVHSQRAPLVDQTSHSLGH